MQCQKHLFQYMFKLIVDINVLPSSAAQLPERCFPSVLPECATCSQVTSCNCLHTIVSCRLSRPMSTTSRVLPACRELATGYGCALTLKTGPRLQDSQKLLLVETVWSLLGLLLFQLVFVQKTMWWLIG